MKRYLFSLVAVAAVASFAGAQQPTSTMGDSAKTAHHSMMAGKHHKSHKSHSKTHSKSAMKTMKSERHTSASGGEVDLRDNGLAAGGPGYSLHAVPRDFVGADASVCDALCRREHKMDAMCGKDRERCGTH